MSLKPPMPDNPRERRVVKMQLVAFIGLPVVVIICMLVVIFIRAN